MIGLTELKKHHLVGDTETSQNIKEALKLQVSVYLQAKYRMKLEVAEIKASNYIEKNSLEIKNCFLNRDIDTADEIINKYNNTDNRKNHAFTDLMYYLKNDDIRKAFEKKVVKNITNNRQAQGLALLALENNINGEKTYNINTLLKSLINFNEENSFLSKNKIIHNLRKKEEYEYNEKDPLNNAIEFFKQGVEKTFDVLHDVVMLFLDKMESDIEKMFKEYAKNLKEFLQLFYLIPLEASKVCIKVAENFVNDIDNLDLINLEKRRNNKKLKYRRV